jgi:hypothetical protein
VPLPHRARRVISNWVQSSAAMCLSKFGQDVMKQIHQQMALWWDSGGLQPARLVREMARELACPVVGVENATVHGKDDETGYGRRGRCGGGDEVWLPDEHGDSRLSALACRPSGQRVGLSLAVDY